MNIGQKYDIFISYRRATGANAARMIQLALTARGYSVFLDYDSLEDGKFNEAIYSAIDSCEVFILMMTEGALDRCTNPGDWVRLEIQRAIEQKKNIVPVAPSDQTWSFPTDIPQALSILRNVHVSKLDMESLFNESVVKIEAARFPRGLRDRARGGQSGTGAEVGMAEMFKMFARAKREWEVIANLPCEYKSAYVDEIRAFEDDLSAAEDARANSLNAVATMLVEQALRQADRLNVNIEDERRANPGEMMTAVLPGGESMTFCWCPATTSAVWKKMSGGEDFFLMGRPVSEPYYAYEEKHDKNIYPLDDKQHCVTLTKGFWMGKYQVTQRQWESVMGENPAKFKGADRPVEQVSWEDCQRFIRRINDVGKIEVSLPTEAQWEFACRAGTTAPLNFVPWKDGIMAHCIDSIGFPSPRGTCCVGTFSPNAWGLYDMHGNVEEWCLDWVGDFEADVIDPKGPTTGYSRICRGGSWADKLAYCRSWYRYGCEQAASYCCTGLRLVCTMHPCR